MRSWRIIACFVVLAAFTGCAPKMPQLAAPTKLQDLQLSKGLVLTGATQPAKADWWQALLNERQQEILRLALRNNPDLEEAEARVRLAAASLRSAGAKLSPQADLAGHIGVSRWTQNQFYLPPYAGESSWNNALKLDFSYHFDLWGKEQERVHEAQLQLLMMQQKQKAATLVLEAAVLQQLLAIAGNAAALAQLHAEQRILQQIESIEEQREQHGLSNSLLALENAARLSRLQREIEAEGAQREQNREALAILCGQGTRLPTALRDPDPQSLIQPHWRSPTQVPAAWVGARPDVVAQRNAIEAAAAAIQVARDAYYPNINLVAFAGGLAAAGGLFTFLHPGSLQAGIGPAISLPIFSGGRLRGNFDASKANYDLTLAQYRKTLLQALQQVAGDLTTLQAAAQERASLQHREAILEHSARLQQQRYQAGLSNALPALEAQIPLIENRLERLRLDTHAEQTLVGLYAALGGRVVMQTWPGTSAGHG
nr:efflux transporter outer membrane subunit [Acidithiobacillus sp. AMEEHan]